MGYPFFVFSIGITTASAAFLGIAMTRKIKYLKNDWANQRCKPHGLVAAAIPGLSPKGVTATQNYKECQFGMFQGFFNTLITPITTIIYLMSDIMKEFTNNIFGSFFLNCLLILAVKKVYFFLVIWTLSKK